VIASLGLSVGLVRDASAFRPVARPWPATPERILRTTAHHREARPVRSELRPASFRADGTVAILWGGPREAPQNLSGAFASELALSRAHRMAPDLGVDPGELFVSHATELDGLTVITVRQSYLGVPIERAFLSFTFRDGSLALVRNELLVPSIDPPKIEHPAAVAEALALEEASSYAESALVGSELVFWAPGDRGDELRLAWKVRTRSQRPRSELDFFIDAETLAVLAADDRVRYADGEGRVRILVDPVTPDDPEVPFSTPFVDAGALATDGDGETRQNGAVSLTYDGPYVRVSDQSGTPIETFELDFTGPYRTYDHTPQYLSQADPFVHLNVMKKFARTITPELAWLEARLTVNVNINDNCNAFWDGQTVNFFVAGNGCNNTGRIASIVYHEFGHGYHQFLADNIVGSVGEGTGDFLAATLLSDPVVGRGFAQNGGGIRRIDDDRRFPEDYVGEVHEDGLIWASALWDLREAMIAKHGEWRGRILTDRLFIQALAQGPGLSTSYPAIIAADDDDNEPANGSPNSCEINAVWDAHGMIESGQIQHTRAGERAFVRIEHAAPGRFAADADGSITVTATLENRSACGTFDPSALVLLWAPDLEGGAFQPAAGGKIEGLSPGQSFRYYFELAIPEATFTSGSEAKPHVGAVDRGQRDVARFDFEAGMGDWTHGTVGSDLVDDWDVAEPHGQYFDPFSARSGTRVAGTDLGSGGGPGGTDGAAKPGRHTFFESGPITTGGMKEIELELWHHFAIDGTIRALADGSEVWARSIANDWSGGWRYASVRLPDALSDRSAPFTVRFEVETSATNGLGGWTIDDVAITGIEIPPPPPPPDDPPPDDPPPEDPPDKPVDPGQVPTEPIDPDDPMDPLVDPTMDPAPPAATPFTRQSISGGCVCVSRESFGSSLLVACLALVLILLRR
jgi:hypothetical protein